MSKPHPDFHSIFSALPWALPLLNSPEWVVAERFRMDPAYPIDSFVRDRVHGPNGLLYQAELYKVPSSPSSSIEETVSLFSFAEGLMGFSGITHGGALATMLDESVGFAMVANERQRDSPWNDWNPASDASLLETMDSVTMMQKLKGFYVTANLDIRFLRPVLCPNVVGVHTRVIENNGKSMKIRGVMKDAKSEELATVDTIWIKLGRAARL
ncbi:hypothetical protein M501DRAFT_1003296 [Patellaria atrata CBS 101060]|uniref:Thioesterase domain-containing protein n=1 Tax=Patellaria atrata CBS 101060 TaxID=1346257 RepID=A0A9P4SBX2_9PEZI|nr:hypothetical protein M501DRAFT_1003296 [Patellaria atrata CBS 101060]